jgi:hypothetical protein
VKEWPAILLSGVVGQQCRVHSEIPRCSAGRSWSLPACAGGQSDCDGSLSRTVYRLSFLLLVACCHGGLRPAALPQRRIDSSNGVTSSWICTVLQLLGQGHACSDAMNALSVLPHSSSEFATRMQMCTPKQSGMAPESAQALHDKAGGGGV